MPVQKYSDDVVAINNKKKMLLHTTPSSSFLLTIIIIESTGTAGRPQIEVHEEIKSLKSPDPHVILFMGKLNQIQQNMP